MIRSICLFYLDILNHITGATKREVRGLHPDALGMKLKGDAYAPGWIRQTVTPL
jgi:hypothetical protein